MNGNGNKNGNTGKGGKSDTSKGGKNDNISKQVTLVKELGVVVMVKAMW